MTQHMHSYYMQHKSYVRGLAKPGIIHACNRPYKVLTINNDGECYLCVCEAWLPTSAGNIESFDTLDQVWNNPIAKQLQQDISAKNYTQCAVEHCGVMYRDMIEDSYYINVALDNSCNLACPSCRREMINHTQGPEYAARQRRVDHFLQLLQRFDQPLRMILIGNGDPLASAVMRPIVLNWQPKSNQSVILFTNGLLMKKLLPDSAILPHITQFQISVDAGTKHTYETVRRPGRYEVLRENLDWLAQNLPRSATVILKFTISAMNAKDLVNFSEMCKTYGFRGEVTKLDDWNTFDDFSSQEVILNTNHVLHATAIENLKIVSQHQHIHLSPLFKKYI